MFSVLELLLDVTNCNKRQNRADKLPNKLKTRNEYKFPDKGVIGMQRPLNRSKIRCRDKRTIRLGNRVE